MGENTLAVISYISCIARRVLFLIYEGGGKFLSKFKAKNKVPLHLILLCFTCLWRSGGGGYSFGKLLYSLS